MNKFVVVGIVSKPHGLFGQVKVIPTTNIWNSLTGMEKLRLYDESRNQVYELQVEQMIKTGKSILVKFANINNAETASKLVGLNVVVDLNQLPKLKKDEFYYFEVLGIDVYDESGNFLGKIEDVLSTGSNEVLIIRKEGHEILFPMIRDYIVDFEKGKKLKIRLPEWI